MWYIGLLALVGFVAEQSDWVGGSGVLGPVPNWGTRYYVGDSITTATDGQVSLKATQCNYTNWTKHIVESNSGIPSPTQGFMPADIDGNGITDLIAHTADQVVWYEHDGNYGFSKHVIGSANNGGQWCPCVYPCDIDQDGDIDGLVATPAIGVGWFENQTSFWLYHSLDNSTGYIRVWATDVEMDGDLDVLAVDLANSSGYTCGDICLFRNDGSQNFTKELAADFPTYDGWRAYSADFNGDGFPDLCSIAWHSSHVFLNDGTGHFAQSWHGDLQTGAEFDGGAAEDIDMDGDMDLVCAGFYVSSHPFYAMLNDGTGRNFDVTLLAGTLNSYAYADGAMACDIDLDGWPDIMGANQRVGWFRQDPSNPLTFTLYDIESLSGGSHWIHGASLCDKCIPAVDLLVTINGAHIVYENRMLEAFANLGHLESSILEFTSDSVCTLTYFGYQACVPNDSSLCFRWRAGIDSATIANKPWGDPHFAAVGRDAADSFALGLIGVKAFQYRVEFRGDTNDIAVLHEVWLTYECGPSGIEEEGTNRQWAMSNWQLSVFPNPFTRTTVISYQIPVGAQRIASLQIHDAAGRLVKTLVSQEKEPGRHTIDFDARGLPPGIYFARLAVGGDHRQTRKLILVR